MANSCNFTIFNIHEIDSFEKLKFLLEFLSDISKEDIERFDGQVILKKKKTNELQNIFLWYSQGTKYLYINPN